MNINDWVMWSDNPYQIKDVLDEGAKWVLHAPIHYKRSGAAPAFAVVFPDECIPTTKEVVDIMLMS